MGRTAWFPKPLQLRLANTPLPELSLEPQVLLMMQGVGLGWGGGAGRGAGRGGSKGTEGGAGRGGGEGGAGGRSYNIQLRSGLKNL